jgi:hypothetical protein
MNKKHLTVFLISLAVFLVFILTTSPYHMPLVFVVVPGVAFIVAVYHLLAIIFGYLPVRQKVGRSIVKVLTLILAILAILLSVGQLTFRDFALLLALALFGMFYLSRMLDR